MLKSNKSGITILEAMITIFVIMIGLLALSSLIPLAFKISQSAERSTAATNLAQAGLEELFYLNFDNIPVGVIEAKARLSGDTNNWLYNYQREILAEYVDSDLQTSTTATDLKKITVNIYWHNPYLRAEKMTQLTSLIAKK